MMTDVIGRRTVGLLKFRVLLDHRQSYISKQKSSSHLILDLAREVSYSRPFYYIINQNKLLYMIA